MAIRLTRPFPLSRLHDYYTWSRYTQVKNPYHTEETFVKQFEEAIQTGLSWAVWLDEDLVGFISIEPYHHFSDPVARDAWLHFGLARSAWGRDIIQQVLPSVIETVFRSVPALQRITCSTIGPYPPIGRLVCNLGFRPEGTIREAVKFNDKTQDIHLYGLTRSDLNELLRK